MTLESYVYTIHDLQLEYLKSQLRDDEEKEKVNLEFDFVKDFKFLKFLKNALDG